MRLPLLLVLALAALAGIAAPRPAVGQAQIVLKFSHVVAPDAPKGKAALRFKELAESYTAGRVRVDVFPNSQLHKDEEELEALQLGVVQMLAPSLAKFGPLGIREFEIFDLPFLLPDRAALRRVVDGEIGRRLLDLLDPKGIVGLAYWDNGFKVLTANRAVREPGDLRGLTMRIQGSRVLDAQFRKLGAVPRALPFSDVYEAMRTGAVDGSENTPSNIWTQRHHEVQRSLTVSEHGYLGYALVANKRFWIGLPADVRRALDRAVREATDYANRIAGQENEAALDALRRSGRIEVLPLGPEGRDHWRKALDGVYAEQVPRLGRELVDDIRRVAGQPAN